jgi:hypothetical protein
MSQPRGFYLAGHTEGWSKRPASNLEWWNGHITSPHTSTNAISHVLQPTESTIPGAGRGCFITQGHVQKGGVLTLYPGLALLTDALPSLWLKYSDDAFDAVPPLFLVGNSYLLRVCTGGQDWMLDGRPVGLSAARFRVAAKQAGEVSGVPVNTAWLEDDVGDEGGERYAATRVEYFVYECHGWRMPLASVMLSVSELVAAFFVETTLGLFGEKVLVLLM